MTYQTKFDARTGHFLADRCDDPNCDGSLVADFNVGGDPVWRCNGMTFVDMGGPLFACAREFPRVSADRTER